jgi:hypothetical protein
LETNWVVEGEDFCSKDPRVLTAAACTSALFFCAVWCSTCVKSIIVSTVLLLFEVMGTNPQYTELIKTLVMSPGGFSTTNIQFTIIKYNVLVENLFFF